MNASFQATEDAYRPADPLYLIHDHDARLIVRPVLKKRDEFIEAAAAFILARGNVEKHCFKRSAVRRRHRLANHALRCERLIPLSFNRRSAVSDDRSIVVRLHGKNVSHFIIQVLFPIDSVPEISENIELLLP